MLKLSSKMMTPFKPPKNLKGDVYSYGSIVICMWGIHKVPLDYMFCESVPYKETELS